MSDGRGAGGAPGRGAAHRGARATAAALGYPGGAMPWRYPVHLSRGVHLPAAGLWLDATRRRDLAVVSHAHGDHIARHHAVVCTPATFRLLQSRVRGPVEPRLLEYGAEAAAGDDGATVSLHSAGHVLGSAQVLVRHRGLRVLYSGDIRTRPSRTAAPIEHVECDLLIVEATFGHPHYRFPPVAQVMERVVAWCTAALRDGSVPVLLAYSLGKAQELLVGLDAAGLRVVLHASAFATAQLYRDLGVALPHAARLDEATVQARDAVVVVPPHLRGLRILERLRPHRVALLSGWAVDGGAPLRLRCDAAFPLSDHCDFDELVEYVLRTRARRVLTMHGFAADLAHQLRHRGVDASPLAVPEQLALALAR